VGKVYGPEDVLHRRGKSVPDLTPEPLPQRYTPTRIEEISKDVELMKAELVKIKLAMKAHGIAIE
jgi:hypothetical protein